LGTSVDPCSLTVARAVAEIRQGRLSPVSLAQALLQRIDRLEPQLHAWVTVDRELVLEQAHESLRKLERGEKAGPLHGVPIGVKDVFYTEGMRTTAGSAYYADFVPTHDSAAVARLKRAGAIILGKTVTSEFASAPWPNGQPKTRNAWRHEHTPGGSSMGSAVAVAARMCPAALGNQMGGSTLRPAAYNGVAAMKPTFGLISKYGVFPCSWSIDTVGIFARTVEDLAMLVLAMAGHDPLDPTSAQRPVEDYVSAVHHPKERPRIGLVRQFFFERSDQEVRKHTEDVAERFARAGATVEEATLPVSLDDVFAVHTTISQSEMSAYHEELVQDHPEAISPDLRASLRAGMFITAVKYLQAQRVRRRFRAQMEALASRFDVLLTPTTPSPAPRDLTTTGDPVFQNTWTNLGFPTVTLPSGLSKSGMPLGVQLISPPFTDAALFSVASWCEGVLQVWLVPPLVGANPDDAPKR